jgi:hypothetical protein
VDTVGTFSQARRMGGFRSLIRLIYFTGHSSFAVPLGCRGAKTFTTEGTGEHRVNLRRSAFDVLLEHFFGIDGDEDAAAAGEDFIFFVEDLCGIDVDATADFDFAAFYAERFTQWNRLEILDGHLSRERNHMMKLIYFAHGIVEDAGDDAAVGMAGRSGVALAQEKVADEGLAFFVEDEF